MNGYEFVKEKNNIDRYGIRVENGENEATMFFGKVMFNGKRYLGKYHPGHGACYIAVGEKEEKGLNYLEILQSKS